DRGLDRPVGLAEVGRPLTRRARVARSSLDAPFVAFARCADHGQPKRADLDRGPLLVPDAVDTLVLGLEARDQRIDPGGVDRAARKLGLECPAPACVPRVPGSQRLPPFL